MVDTTGSPQKEGARSTETQTSENGDLAGFLSLFKTIESLFDQSDLGKDQWYLLALSALVGGGCTEAAPKIYLYLIEKPQFSTSSERQHLTRRLREVLVKSVSLIGVCKPMEAILNLKEVEKPEDKDYSFSREGWESGPANHARGVGWMSKLYKGNMDGALQLFEHHKDFAWISTEITYGLYLSDHSILGEVETELVVLPSIMIQNLAKETHWHIRGTRRIGVSKDDTRIICQCVETVAQFLGLKLDRVPKPDEVEYDV
ncbi:hypothetical protein BX600DRAFT_444312 [Xylariales sp. PMI_506]|nr:hypothetical protein BX600DRAFT_444312 [Xylariales sp. PMI_506]